MQTLLTEMGSSGEYFNAEWKYDARCMPSTLHCHDYFEIYVFLSGNGTFFLDDRLYDLSSNQFIVIPPFLMHGIVDNLELFNYERGSLYLSSKALLNVSFSQIDMEQFLNDMSKDGYCFDISDDVTNDLKRLTNMIHRFCASDDPLDRFSAYTYIAEFMGIICREGKNLANPDKHGDKSGISYDILMYINDNYTKQLSIKDIAEHFGISRSGLMHMFSEYTGHSIYDYILYRRITKAKELMYTDRSLNEIAYECGFNDYSNFLRVFKKQVGESPREYKKKH